MGERTAGRTARFLVGLVLAVVIGSGGVAGDVEPWIPETLPGFIRALELGIAQNLTPDERLALSGGTHEALRETHPELHEKIRHCVATWTERWVRRATQDLEGVSERRIRRAEQAAADVDLHLRAYFEARGWTYRPLKVVFLPQHLMTEPELPAIKARGMYVLYYPDVFFTALDSETTIRHTLIHESLHFNKTGPGLGRALSEGIAEVAATELALDWGMVRRKTLRWADYYRNEVEIVEYIVERMIERTGMQREHALELLLHAYLTGDSTEMESIFGTTAWSETVRASRDLNKVRKTAKRALGS